VVKYVSAHIDGVESERVVNSPHSCQSNADTIDEVRRILRLHATDVACGRQLQAFEAPRAQELAAQPSEKPQ